MGSDQLRNSHNIYVITAHLISPDKLVELHIKIMYQIRLYWTLELSPEESRTKIVSDDIE